MKNISLVLLMSCGFVGGVTTLSAASAQVEPRMDNAATWGDYQRSAYLAGYQAQQKNTVNADESDAYYKLGVSHAETGTAAWAITEQEHRNRANREEQPGRAALLSTWLRAHGKQIAGGVAGAFVGWQVVRKAPEYISTRTLVAAGALGVYPTVKLVRSSLTPFLGAPDAPHRVEKLAAAGVGAGLLVAAYKNGYVPGGSYTPAVAKAALVAGSGYVGTQLVARK